MITITEAARKKIVELKENTGKSIRGLRIRAEARSPLKVNYQMAFILDGQDEPGDTVVNFEGVDVFIDPNSLPHAEDATIDYVDGLTGSGFKIDAPRKLPPSLSGPVAQRIQAVIDEKINPGVASHGGLVSLIDIKDNIAYIQLGGGCQGCGMADVTLKQGIEVMIKEAAPEIQEVLDVTDHASGRNPYYQQTK
ncbi:MAG: iron-sulfur cluster assembly accessory protein [Candidatus Latescibacteria bacterium]|nr:iron-sulfur cluster assembly accessory protein [Candidatus Latescibacterota bacterium]